MHDSICGNVSVNYDCVLTQQTSTPACTNPTTSSFDRVHDLRHRMDETVGIIAMVATMFAVAEKSDQRKNQALDLDVCAVSAI